MSDSLETKSLVELEELVSQARQRYADLRGKASARSFRHVLMSREDWPVASTDGQRRDTVTARAAATSKRRRIGDVHVAYRLSGHTIFPVAPHESGIRFETSCFGEYHEQYYAFVRFDDGDRPVLYRHTLPPFVPVARFAETLQSDGLKPFMVAVSNHLNAFVGRREQLRLFQSDFADRLIGVVACSTAVDFVSFCVRDDRPTRAGALDVRLLYESLDSMLPTRAVVKECAVDDDNVVSGTGERDRAAEQALKSKLLADAMKASLASQQ